MTRTEIVYLIIVVAVLLLTVPTARASIRKRKIYGGTPSQLFHFLGVAFYIAVLPAGVCGTALVGFGFGLPLLLIFLALAFVSLFIFAVFERPLIHNEPNVSRGWTEEDARSSGL
jgi:hypothetical protein